MELERIGPRALLVRISGYDRGIFGTTILDAVTSELKGAEPLELFVDASEARGAVWDVTRLWTSWFRDHQNRLARVVILVRSRLTQQMILVAKELSRTANLISVVSDADRFRSMMGDEAPRRS